MKEIRRYGKDPYLILTEITVRERKRGKTVEKESKGMIAREIRPSIEGGYQRNKGTAGGKVHAISAKKSLVKGIGRWKVGMEEKDTGATWRKKRQKGSEGVSEDRFCII